MNTEKGSVQYHDYNISLIRLAALIMIVTCHFLQYEGNELAWWLNIGVQIFLFISGFLYANKKIEIWTFYKQNFLKIIIPYLLVLIPALLIHIFILDRSFSIVGLFRIIIALDLLKGGGHLWFVQYILLCYFITPFLKKIFEKCANSKSISMKIMVVLIILFFLCLVQTYRISAWYFVFILGLFLGNTHLEKRIKYIIYCVIVVLSVIINMICIYYNYISLYEFGEKYKIIYEIFSNYGRAFLGISIFVIFKAILEKLKNGYSNQTIKLLDFSDKYSYNIYLVHQFIILGPLSLMSITNYKLLNIVLICSIIIALAIINNYVSKLLLKIIYNKGGKK